jgi:CubicO group peptidase (beta-lactamase class C family)
MIESKSYPSLSKGWSTPISSVIPEDFVLEDEWATKHVTLEDAVSHRTGLPRHDLAFFRELDGKKSTVRDLVRNLRNLVLTEEPRAKFMYCNFMYVVLSHVIETIMGKGLGNVLKEQIWAPLGMDSTYHDLHEAKKKSESFATGYYWDKENEEFVTAPDMDLTDISGAGAIFSNVLDYAKWVKCLLHKDTLFSEATHREIKKPRMMSGLSPLPGMDLETYSLAWQRSVYRGNVIYHHSGGVHAFGSQVYWLPQHKFGVVAHGNTAMTSNAAEDVLIYKLINDKLEIPQEQRFDPSNQ